MHPILARLERLAAYLALWTAIGVLIGLVLTRQGLTWPEALVLVLPPLLGYAFVCLSAWYVCRAMPLASSGVPGVLTASVVAATKPVTSTRCPPSCSLSSAMPQR